MQLKLTRTTALLERARRAFEPDRVTVAPWAPEDEALVLRWRNFEDALALDGAYGVAPAELAKATLADLSEYREQVEARLRRTEEDAARQGWSGANRSTLRRLRDELERVEDAETHIFSLAHPALVNGVPDETIRCTTPMCSGQLASARQRFEQSGLCASCWEQATGQKRDLDKEPPTSIEAAVTTVLRRAGIREAR